MCARRGWVAVLAGPTIRRAVELVRSKQSFAASTSINFRLSERKTRVDGRATLFKASTTLLPRHPLRQREALQRRGLTSAINLPALGNRSPRLISRGSHQQRGTEERSPRCRSHTVSCRRWTRSRRFEEPQSNFPGRYGDKNEGR